MSFLSLDLSLTGELAALSAACLWAVASVIYSRVGQTIHPLELNLFKGAIAVVLLLFTIFISGDVLPPLAFNDYLFFILSGMLGIGLGDSAFLTALKYLGARRTLLMETLAPPMTAILALLFLQEQLSFAAWCGIILTIVGIAWVLSERTPNIGTHHPTHLLRGISFGILAAIALATGAVLSRAVFATTTVSSLWAALLRLSGGLCILIPWVALKTRSSGLKLPSRRAIAAIFIASFTGTYLGIWLQQTAIKLTAAGIALTLTNTSPLFVLPLAAAMGERISFRAIAGVAIAIAGIAVLFYLQ
ncbi:DMT family transporter [Chroogloeocystis siderophila]|jgi:drug/metabolite transporter (DMT)-like permease|uniref:EamA family transporter n=1 Tax=Chroogloeocystis siderophila 5.2 s.c.1 TaxID=247279 RepID=A0A1U7HQN7_9CHRO|nr:DMT family transporter [Chroogloeocystis siderophila]OKH25879.1 EamA family transporter [Chroogloeocystis siderophila 5.2 s.c.1]